MSLLEVEKLSIEFKNDGQWLPVVSDVSFKVDSGEVLALVGESGCGKSVTCMSLAKLLPQHQARYASGRISFIHRGQKYDTLSLPVRQLREIRGAGIAYIFQEPSVSLNPVFRIGDQIAEAISLHQPDEENVRDLVIELLRRVGISDPERRIRCYPHEMSGGMQQRVMIAMALASNPELLVADEPTTALDVTIQAQILELLGEIRKQRNMAIILVTHNLGIVAELATRVAVMYAGHIVELAATATLLSKPVHPYTLALLAAVPKLKSRQERLNIIPGMVPSPANFPKGCRFYGRCQRAAALSAEKQQLCADAVPEWEDVGENHFCRCWYKNEKDI
jgi:oligopeptide/dipeptide ABC transporter ATP-binding protein